MITAVWQDIGKANTQIITWLYVDPHPIASNMIHAFGIAFGHRVLLEISGAGTVSDKRIRVYIYQCLMNVIKKIALFNLDQTIEAAASFMLKGKSARKFDYSITSSDSGLRQLDSVDLSSLFVTYV